MDIFSNSSAFSSYLFQLFKLYNFMDIFKLEYYLYKLIFHIKINSYKICKSRQV